MENNSENKYLNKEEMLFLKNQLKFFLSCIDEDKRMDELKKLAALYSNPKKTVLIAQDRAQGIIFDEIPTLKCLVSDVMQLLRPKWSFSKNKVLKRALKKVKCAQNNFEISTEDVSFEKFKKYKRKKTKFSKKKDQTNKINRILRYSSRKENKSLSLIPTIKNSIKKGNYNLGTRNLKVSKSDFLYPFPIQDEQINMMVILDSSKSISWFVRYIEKFLPIITTFSFKNRDKIGYITYKNDSAQIIHYPTLNVRQVIGSINETKIEGATPLAEGIQLANQVFRKQQYNYPGVKNMVLMISDCFPEPLEGGYENMFDEPAYKKMLTETKKLTENKIDLTIVNPALLKNNKYNWGQQLAKKLQQLYKINYLEINKPQSRNPFVSEEKLMDQQLQDLAEEFLEMEF